MKAKATKFFYLVLLVIFFTYGFSIGFFKIFPFPQLLEIKHYMEYSAGTFEAQKTVVPPDSVEILETSLQRLLIKKIQIPGFTGHGGGFSTSGNLLFIVSNKGSVHLFDIDQYRKLDHNIPDVPLNFRELIRSGHPYKNDFHIPWFRVNGVHSELLSDATYVLFVSHNAYDQNKDCITHNISRIEIFLTDSTVNHDKEWDTIFTASPCLEVVPENLISVAPYPGHISGGTMVNFDEDNLLVSVGDYDRQGIDGTDEYAMDPSNPYGKTILVNKMTGRWSIFTMGNRNATGLYIDKQSKIWSVENGPKGGDELNLLKEGNNYGWPKVSYGLWYDSEYNLSGEPKRGTHPGYRKPIFSWIPSVAPSSITKIEGDKFEYWKEDLLMGTMRDESLHRLRMYQDRIVYNERIPLGHRIRDLITLPDQKIALMTDDGFLIIIDDGGPSFKEMDSLAEERIMILNNYDIFSGYVDNQDTIAHTDSTSMAIFLQNCANCHSLDTRNQIGPHLSNLLNRTVGSAAGYNYSGVLKRDKRKWTPRLLESFLRNPEEEFPGVQMQRINLSSNEIDSLIHFFELNKFPLSTN